MKELIVFDLDGTLAESKSALDLEMANLLDALLGVVKVAVISGGNWPQFDKQDFAIRLGGTTSVDITKPGVDKAYGIRKLRDILGVGIGQMIFVGDALFPGGSDYPAKQAGVVSIQVKNPGETKRVVEAILACLSGTQKTPPPAEESQ